MSEYIDRESFRRAMYQESFEKDSDLQRWDGGCWIRYKLFENVIESVPVADVRPVIHGEWVYDENGLDWNLPAWKCSECGAVHGGLPVFGGKEKLHLFVGSSFCPNCGADMRSVFDGKGEE